MTSNEEQPPNWSATAEKTRKLIREFVETPPPKTMADVKAASEVYEANAEQQGAGRTKEAEKPQP